MQCINRVVVAGNLGRDPEIGATPKGMLVAKFSVAVDTPGRVAPPGPSGFNASH
jgi:single-stranded DNA-binding protein